MEVLPISKFKSTCLAVLEQVAKQKKRIVITKRGKPIAEIVPYEAGGDFPPLQDTVAFMGDIISPVGAEDWEILK